MERVDAVVVGSGPNGLVAACLLADAGWDVLVLEAQPRIGGAVATVECPPGFRHDAFSSFYPLAARSPVLERLDLGAHGLRWCHAPGVLAHPHPPDASEAALLSRDRTVTAAGLDRGAPGDGEAWFELCRQWEHWSEPLRAALRLLTRAGGGEGLRLARMLSLPVDRLARELFRGPDGQVLLAGNAAHADVPAVAAGSGLFGWLLAMLGQDVGFPVPSGGAGALADALAGRARSAGARIDTDSEVERIVVHHGRAVGVLTVGGRTVGVRRAVVADVPVPALYRRLLAGVPLPDALLDDLRRFEWDPATVKVNWALDAPVPWRAEAARQAGTVHIGAACSDDSRLRPGIGRAELTQWSVDLATERPGRHVFALVGQPGRADPSRAPAGGDTVWAYTHVPRDRPPEEAGQTVELLERCLEANAPGFTDHIVRRWSQRPDDLTAHDANLVGGAVNGGTAQLHQQLVFRPIPGFGRSETVVRGLYLASAGAHPGGGVHGMAGANAASAALAGARLGGLPARTLVAALRRLYRPAAG
jgi:phytoene dehydrogenase-like protein